MRLRAAPGQLPGILGKLLLCVLVSVLCAACAVGGGGVDRPDPARIRIASFDFPESRLLAEVYGQHLRQAGFQVDVIAGLGTREVVQPALELGLVDIVPHYSGSLLNYFGGSETETHRAAEQVHAALQPQLAARGLTALRYAPAEDVNGFAVLRGFAQQYRLSKVSDLRELRGRPELPTRLILGGPPECQSRRYCLKGLQELYGLDLDFRAQSSRAATALALETGEIQVGMLETTYGRLGERRVVLLVDDKNLQPRENVVPVVRTEVIRRHGVRLTDAVNEISAELTTGDLIRLNRAAATNPFGPAAVAAAYLNAAR